MSDDQLLNWIRLACHPGISWRARRALLQRAGHCPHQALEPDAVDPAWVSAQQIRQWQHTARRAGFSADRTWLEQSDSTIVGLGEPAYPDLLAEIPDPPLVLFVSGNVRVLDRPQIALVGSRRASVDGLRNASEFSDAFSRAGLMVTSGLALGVDGAAHRAALDAGCATIAVMATGPDRIYPRRHADLAAAVRCTGALVTEFPCGAAPRPQHFARRNRIISGLCLGAVVIEAARASGSLITARLAGEQGRDVFALPGPAGAPGSAGSHSLIRQGAMLVDSPEDVIDSLGWTRRPARQCSDENLSSVPEAGVTCSQSERAVLDQLGYTPMSIDELVVFSGLTAAEVCSIVLALELSGLLIYQGGMVQRRLCK